MYYSLYVRALDSSDGSVCSWLNYSVQLVKYSPEECLIKPHHRFPHSLLFNLGFEDLAHIGDMCEASLETLRVLAGGNSRYS